MTNQANIEAVNEPTMRFQLFLQTTSAVHLAGGSPFRLTFSSDDMSEIFIFITEDVNTKLDSIMIKDTECMS